MRSVDFSLAQCYSIRDGHCKAVSYDTFGSVNMETAKKRFRFSKEVNMLEGSIVNGLLGIAIPIMIMNVITSLFNIVDMSILKMFDTDGGYAVGAVGACGTLISLITGLVIGCSAGANVCIAKRIGKGDKEGVDRAVGTSIVLSLVGGLILTAIGVSFAEIFLGWMNCPDRLMKQAALYFRMYFAGCPILMLYNFVAAVLRSSGDTKRPMLYLITGSAVKLAMTFLFVGVFKMQVMGVSIATIISWTVMALLASRALVFHGGAVQLKLDKLRFYKEELREILAVGIPAGLQQALYSIANVIITATVNSYGPDATTGISIANNFDGVLYQISHSPSLAVMPYVSQNVGAGNLKRAKKSIVRGMLITTALGATFGSLSAIFSGQLASIMTDTPAVITYAQQKMVIISSTYFICGINDIMGAAMRGLGKPLIPTIATLIYMCGIRFIWVYLIFPFMAGNMTFLYLIWPIGWILSLITLTAFYFPTVKKLAMRLGECEEKTKTVA